MYISIHACICIYIYIYICVYVCMHVHMNIRRQRQSACIYLYACICTFAFTCFVSMIFYFVCFLRFLLLFGSAYLSHWLVAFCSLFCVFAFLCLASACFAAAAAAAAGRLPPAVLRSIAESLVACVRGPLIKYAYKRKYKCIKTL